MPLTFGFTRDSDRPHFCSDSIRFKDDGSLEMWRDRAAYPLVEIQYSGGSGHTNLGSNYLIWELLYESGDQVARCSRCPPSHLLGFRLSHPPNKVVAFGQPWDPVNLEPVNIDSISTVSHFPAMKYESLPHSGQGPVHKRFKMFLNCNSHFHGHKRFIVKVTLVRLAHDGSVTRRDICQSAPIKVVSKFLDGEEEAAPVKARSKKGAKMKVVTPVAAARVKTPTSRGSNSTPRRRGRALVGTAMSAYGKARLTPSSRTTPRFFEEGFPTVSPRHFRVNLDSTTITTPTGTTTSPANGSGRRSRPPRIDPSVFRQPPVPILSVPPPLNPQVESLKRKREHLDSDGVSPLQSATDFTVPPPAKVQRTTMRSSPRFAQKGFPAESPTMRDVRQFLVNDVGAARTPLATPSLGQAIQAMEANNTADAEPLMSPSAFLNLASPSTPALVPLITPTLGGLLNGGATPTGFGAGTPKRLGKEAKACLDGFMALSSGQQTSLLMHACTTPEIWKQLAPTLKTVASKFNLTAEAMDTGNPPFPRINNSS